MNVWGIHGCKETSNVETNIFMRRRPSYKKGEAFHSQQQHFDELGDGFCGGDAFGSSILMSTVITNSLITASRIERFG